MQSGEAPHLGVNPGCYSSQGFQHSAGPKQSTFCSYSFRNADSPPRLWGNANEGDDKEDNSDSDEEQDIYQSKCFNAVKGLLKALFPNVYPFMWLVLPFILCAIVALAAYGDNDHHDDGLVIVAREPIFLGSVKSLEEETTFVKQVSERDLMMQGVLALVLISTLSAVAWVVSMLIRAVFLTIIVNAGLYEKQTVSSLITTVDPELVYFIWSVGMYTFWQQNLKRGRYYILTEVETKKAFEQLYGSLLFGPSLLVHPWIASWSRMLHLVTILLATRRLVQSVMVFYFELGFMANMSGAVHKYLTRYAALRKLNTRWAAYQLIKETASQSDIASHDDNERMRFDPRAEDLKRGKSFNSVASRVSRVSRYSRHPSVRVSMRAMPSLVKHDQDGVRGDSKAGMPVGRMRCSDPRPSQIREQFKHAQDSKASKGIEGRFVSRAMRVNYFRFKFRVNKDVQARELRGQGIPKPLTRSSIERIKHSKVHHWVLLQYVAIFPPAIFLEGRRIELDSKSTARSVAEELFAALAADEAELHLNEAQAREPLQRSKGVAFVDFSAQNKPQQACENEKTVTWLGSPDLQKVLPMEPVEEGSPTVATAAGPTAAEPYGSSVVEPATVPVVNNSTSATDPLGDGGVLRSDAPSTGASGVAPPADSEAPGFIRKAEDSGSPSSIYNSGEDILQSKESQQGTPNVGDVLKLPPAAAGNGVLERALVEPTSKAANERKSSEGSCSARANEKEAEAGSEDESELLEMLEGSYEFSVNNEKEQQPPKATRRGRTKLFSTLTPFNIAIRAPSVDAEDQEPEEQSFSPDQEQGCPSSSDTFALDIRSSEVPCTPGQARPHQLPYLFKEARKRVRLEESGELELLTPSTRRNLLRFGVDDDELAGSLTHDRSAGNRQSSDSTVPVAPPSRNHMQTAQDSNFLPRQEDRDIELQQAQRTKEDVPDVGAVNTTDSLLNDANCSFSVCQRPSSAPPDCGMGFASFPMAAEGGGIRRLLDPSNAGDEEYSRRPRYGSNATRPEYITRSFVEMFLKGDEVDEFMKQVDVAGHGKINQAMLKRAVISIYKMRKDLLKTLKNQASICKTVRRMISVVLWVATLVGFLLVFGVNLNTVLVSGAASISALVVALSYIYQNFITAVIFVAFTNPYNVGDRVRIDNGDAMFVRNIHTYTTEFVTIYSKPVVYSNSVLFGRQLINESRSTNATFSMSIRVDIRTQLQSLRYLEAGMRKAVEARPMDFVKDSFSIYITDVQPGRWIEVVVWISSVEGWGQYQKVFRLRTDMYIVLQRLCNRLGISYQEPMQPVHISGSHLTASSSQALSLPPSHHFQSSPTHASANVALSRESIPNVVEPWNFDTSVPSGVPLNEVCCEPYLLPRVHPATSVEFSGQGRLKGRQLPAALEPKKLIRRGANCQNLQVEKKASFSSARRRAALIRSFSNSSVASQGSHFTEGSCGSVLSDKEGFEVGFVPDRLANSSAHHVRSCRVPQASAEYGESTNWQHARSSGRPSSEFFGHTVSRRRHRTSEAPTSNWPPTTARDT